VWRYRELTHIGSLFQETNGYVYVNLQLAAYVNDVFTFLLGFCCFFGSLKFLRLGRFNHRLSLLTKTLQHAGKALLSFTFMFSIIFMAFLALFHLLFVSKIWACSSLLHTAQMLFEMTSLKFDVSDLREADAFLGPFCFSLFIFVVVFVCMSMFISIIRDSFSTVRHNTLNEDREILTFMIRKFQRWTGKRIYSARFSRCYYDWCSGWSILDKWELQEERDARLCSENYDPIQRFPDKIDQLLVALNRVRVLLYFCL
jgi:hypothetical protein